MGNLIKRVNTLPAVIPTKEVVVYTCGLVEMTEPRSELGDREERSVKLHDGGVICLGYQA